MTTFTVVKGGSPSRSESQALAIIEEKFFVQIATRLQLRSRLVLQKHLIKTQPYCFNEIRMDDLFQVFHAFYLCCCELESLLHGSRLKFHDVFIIHLEDADGDGRVGYRINDAH